MSAFLVSRLFSEERGDESIYTYGETPLSSMDLIATRSGIQQRDHVWELGCGRGRVAFFLSSVIGCKVTAVDHNPYFIEKAESVLRKCPSMALRFLCMEMENVFFDEPSVIYICSTCLSDQVMMELCKKLQSLSSHVKIITTSFPLTDYAPSAFTIIDTFSVPFNFSDVDVFIQIPSAINGL